MSGNAGADDAHAVAAPPAVLIVDDDPRNRRLLTVQLQAEGYATAEAGDGAAALAAIAAAPPDLVLLDVMMPGMDGYEVVGRLKGAPATCMIPVILVTALADRGARMRGLAAGAEEFLSKPVDRVELIVRVRNLLRVKRFADLLAEHNRLLETRVRERTEQLRASHVETIVTLSRAAEYKDEDTGAHIQRISHYASELVRALGHDAEFAERMFHASPMHDIGKIGIPDHVLLKRGSLTPAEWAVMKTHPTLAWEILRHGTTPLMQLGAEIALSHHERWDGSGYPHGLRGDVIPLSGRIMNICDQYDALRSRRAYKEPLPHRATLAVIGDGDGRTHPAHFDPQVLAAFMRCAARFEEIFDAFRA